MTNFYSPETLGFYVTAVHGENIPADAIEINATQKAEIRDAINKGKTVTHDGSAFTYGAPAVHIESLAPQARNKRNALLNQSDWTQVADAPVDQAAWATYRQSLRDITDQVGFPESVDWPATPTQNP